jgi:redox-sensitive bicupin YhaK (pirin superfamily)
MITVYPFESLGHADHGWLNAHHHFSFARYVNRSRMGFGALRVVNDDIVAAGHGFPAHPHDNMEIITYVRKGAITHKDSMGNEGRTEAGDVQVMSAGSGVMHAEHNYENGDTQLYQIWIEPAQENVAPRWEQRQFPKTFVSGPALPILASGRIEDQAAGALPIYQDAALYGGRLRAGTTLHQPIKHQAYVLASEGSFEIGGLPMKKGDGAEVRDVKILTMTAKTDAEIIVIDVPNAA